MEIHRAARPGALDLGQPLRPRQNRGDDGVLEVGVDEIIEVGFADGVAGFVLVRAHVDGGEIVAAPSAQNHPEMRIAERLRRRIGLHFAAQAAVIDMGHDNS